MSSRQPTLDREFADALRTALVQTVKETRAGGTIVPLRTATSRRWTGTRLALAAASVTGLAIGASLLVPGQSAYAGWSATPSMVGGEPTQTALLECSAGFAYYYDNGFGPIVVEPTWSGGLVEQRGRWQMALVRGEDGTVGECMHILPDDAGDIGGLNLPKMPAPDDIIGVAGEQLGGVALHTEDGDVTASMADGLWAAWWAATYPAAEAPADTGPTGATLSLTDGSTVELNAAQREELRGLDSRDQECRATGPRPPKAATSARPAA